MIFNKYKRRVRELEERLEKFEQERDALLASLSFPFFLRLEQRVEDLEVELGKRKRITGKAVKEDELPQA